MEYDLRELDKDELAADMSHLLESLATMLCNLGEELPSDNEACAPVVVAGAAAKHALALFGQLELVIETDNAMRE